jgi:hypothetical protein
MISTHAILAATPPTSFAKAGRGVLVVAGRAAATSVYVVLCIWCSVLVAEQEESFVFVFFFTVTGGAEATALLLAIREIRATRAITAVEQEESFAFVFFLTFFPVASAVVAGRAAAACFLVLSRGCVVLAAEAAFVVVAGGAAAEGEAGELSGFIVVDLHFFLLAAYILAAYILAAYTCSIFTCSITKRVLCSCRSRSRRMVWVLFSS